MNVGDTFIAPTGPLARFPEREMRVIAVSIAVGNWVDAVPVCPLPTDLYWHSTYKLGADGRPLPVYPADLSFVGEADEGGAS